jgi:drug/metabolite transporter (DMT)-like permease
VALLLGAVVLHEPITTFTALAALMVLAGVALVLFQNWTPRLGWRRALSHVKHAHRHPDL